MIEVEDDEPKVIDKWKLRRAKIAGLRRLARSLKLPSAGSKNRARIEADILREIERQHAQSIP